MPDQNEVPVTTKKANIRETHKTIQKTRRRTARGSSEEAVDDVEGVAVVDGPVDVGALLGAACCSVAIAAR